MFAGSRVDEIADGDAFEAHGLLEGYGEAFFRAFRDGGVRDVLAVVYYAARSGLVYAHNEFYERGFSAAVVSRHDRDAVFGKIQGDVRKNALRLFGAVGVDVVAYIFQS